MLSPQVMSIDPEACLAIRPVSMVTVLSPILTLSLMIMGSPPTAVRPALWSPSSWEASVRPSVPNFEKVSQSSESKIEFGSPPNFNARRMLLAGRVWARRARKPGERLLSFSLLSNA